MSSLPLKANGTLAEWLDRHAAELAAPRRQRRRPRVDTQLPLFDVAPSTSPRGVLESVYLEDLEYSRLEDKLMRAHWQYLAGTDITDITKGE